MGRPAFVLFMIHIDSVIQNIQPVSSLLYSYWWTTSEELYFLEASITRVLTLSATEARTKNLIFSRIEGTSPHY